MKVEAVREFSNLSLKKLELENQTFKAKRFITLGLKLRSVYERLAHKLENYL